MTSKMEMGPQHMRYPCKQQCHLDHNVHDTVFNLMQTTDRAGSPRYCCKRHIGVHTVHYNPLGYQQ